MVKFSPPPPPKKKKKKKKKKKFSLKILMVSDKPIHKDK